MLYIYYRPELNMVRTTNITMIKTFGPPNARDPVWLQYILSQSEMVPATQ